jgi:hypothetical protein
MNDDEKMYLRAEWEAGRLERELAGEPTVAQIDTVPIANYDWTEELEKPATDRRRPESRELQRIRAALIAGDDIKNLPPAQPLIEGVLDLDSIALLRGPSRSLKSFALLDMQLCISTGCWWHRHKITKGPVLAIVAEGASGVGARVEAWEHHNRVHTAGDITWLPIAPNLQHGATVAAVIEVARELRPVLVSIDTLSRTRPGGNENSSENMSAAIDIADQIRQATGACVIYVHHTGYDTTHARGHTSLFGGIDTEIACERSESYGADTIMLRATKQRNHEDGAVIAKLVALPVRNSLALAPYTHEHDQDESDLPANYAAVLEVLAEIAVPSGITATAWKNAAVAAGIEERTFFRARARLVARELVTNVGTDKRPLYVPPDDSVTDTDTATDKGLTVSGKDSLTATDTTLQGVSAVSFDSDDVVIDFLGNVVTPKDEAEATEAARRHIANLDETHDG